MQTQPKVEIFILLPNTAHNTHISQPAHPHLWMDCEAIARATGMNRLVLVICMLKASPLERWVWWMERSGRVIHGLAIIYS